MTRRANVAIEPPLLVGAARRSSTRCATGGVPKKAGRPSIAPAPKDRSKKPSSSTQRPRARTGAGEVALPTFQTMAATDPLDRRVGWRARSSAIDSKRCAFSTSVQSMPVTFLEAYGVASL
jgi:hypothetical protein